MRNPAPKVLGGALALALLSTPFASAASAAPPADEPAPTAVAQSDDRPDAVSDERRELNAKAVELVLKGERKVEQRGGSKAVRVAPGQ